MPFDSAPEVKEVIAPDLVLQIANDAADLLESVGWCQHNGWDGKTGARCVLSAIAYVSGSYANSLDGKKNLIGETVKRLGFGNSTRLNDRIILWNDDPDRTKDQVIARLRSIKGES